jgi:hypothetical protein
MSVKRNTKHLQEFCIILIVIGMIAATFALYMRIRVEQHNKAVDIILEYDEVVSLAGSSGLSVKDTLTMLHNAGATSVALPEDTLKSLDDSGEISISGTRAWSFFTENPRKDMTKWDKNDPSISITVFTPGVRNRLQNSLRKIYPSDSLHIYDTFIQIRGDKDNIQELGLGINPYISEMITSIGLRVVPRVKAESWPGSNSIKNHLELVASSLPAPNENNWRGLVIFDGNMLPGYQSKIKELAQVLQSPEVRLIYGSVEFGKQKGDETLGAALKGELIRVHSATKEEIAANPTDQILQRYTLAVKDRNIRALYVHLPSFPQSESYTIPDIAVKNYISTIATSIRNVGFAVNDKQPAHPFIALSLSWIVLSLLFIAAGASLLLMILTILPYEIHEKYINYCWGFLIIGVIGALGLAVVKPEIGRMIFGLLAGICYPTIALIWIYRECNTESTVKNNIIQSIKLLIVASIITLCGGLLIAATMAETTFIVKVGQFIGSKATLIGPLLIFATLIALGGPASENETIEVMIQRVKDKIKSIMAQPMLVGWSVLAVIALAVVALVIMRSGNESGVGVSSSEKYARMLLDQWMVARPRTKEFLLGHPLMIMAIAAAMQKKKTLSSILMIGGAIGLSDILNTYCHAHTPLLMSLLRTFNGLLLGIVFGIIIAWVLGMWKTKKIEDK